jgi:hypothetical protein
MSLSAVLYATKPQSPEEAIALAFPGVASESDGNYPRVRPQFVEASASLVLRPHFYVEEFGIDPVVEIYFVLDKFHSGSARSEVLRAIQRFLAGAGESDVVVVYMDHIALKRVGGVGLIVERFRGMLPADATGWTVVESIERPPEFLG